MNALVSVSAKGTKTVKKAVRDNFVGVVKAAGVVVGSTALVETPNGEFAVALSVCPATGETVYLNFGRPVVTANDPFALKVKAVVEAEDAPAEVPALDL